MMSMFTSENFSPEDFETEDIELNELSLGGRKKQINFPLEGSWVQSKIVILILIILVISLWIVLWGNKSISYISDKYNILNDRKLLLTPGADLVGGIAIVLEPIFSEDVFIHHDSLFETIKILVSDDEKVQTDPTNIRRIDNRHFEVIIPGNPDLEEFNDLLILGEFIEFVHLGSYDMEFGTSIRTTANSNWLEIMGVEDIESYRSFETVLTGASLVSVNTSITTQGDHAIHFYLDRHGAEQLEECTINNQGNYLAITLNGQIIFSAKIDEPISGGQVSIIGGFTDEQANDLVKYLKLGIGRIPLTIVSTQKISPFLSETYKLILLVLFSSLTLVAVFGMMYFRLPGVICLVSIFTYAVVLMVLFYVLPIMLSISGIVACVLLIGLVIIAQTKLLLGFRGYAKQGRRLLSVIDASWKNIWFFVYKPSVLATCISLCLYWVTKKFNIVAIKDFAIIVFYGIPIGIFLCVIVPRFLLEFFVLKARTATRVNWYRIWN